MQGMPYPLLQTYIRIYMSIKDYFIRPHRQTYYPFDLGPSTLLLNNQRHHRQDFQIHNLQQHKLTVSFYQAQQQHQQLCLVYLHTHNGSKIEALPFVQSILGMGINLCLFDFAGYGNSQGDTVSLGSKEIWDIQCVINHLKLHYRQNQFILWGRSMGAVAALLYLATKAQLSSDKTSLSGMSRHNSTIGGIFDSPFYSLQKLTLQLGAKRASLPQILLKPVVYLLKNSLKDHLDFDQLQLIDKMKQIKIPGVFIASQLDSFVHHSHSQMLYKQYGGRKELVYIDKDHNQTRRTQDLQNVHNFIRKLKAENPGRLQNVLMNNINYRKQIARNHNNAC